MLCKACDHQVSSDALKCPSCGSTLGKMERNGLGVLCIWLFWLFQGYTLFEGISIASKVATMSLSATSVFSQTGIAIGSNMAYSNLFTTWGIWTVVLGGLAIATKPSIVKQSAEKVRNIPATPTPKREELLSKMKQLPPVVDAPTPTTDKKTTGVISGGWIATIVIVACIVGVSTMNMPESQQSPEQVLLSPEDRAAEEARQQKIKDEQSALAAKQAEARRVREEKNRLTAKWNAYTRKSDLDDSTNAYVTVTSATHYSEGFNSGYPTMHIQCRENSTQFYFKVAGEYLVSSEYNSTWGTIKYRLDDLPAGSWRTHESTNNESLGLWNGRGIPQIKKLVGHKTLQVWITPYNESASRFVFDIDGIGEALKDVRANCGW